MKLCTITFRIALQNSRGFGLSLNPPCLLTEVKLFSIQSWFNLFVSKNLSFSISGASSSIQDNTKPFLQAVLTTLFDFYHLGLNEFYEMDFHVDIYLHHLV